MIRTLRLAVIVFVLGAFCAGVAVAQEKPAAATASAPIGLEVGAKAPAFSLPDQFGHTQSNETLKGPKGTVLLFFRSADW